VRDTADSIDTNRCLLATETDPFIVAPVLRMPAPANTLTGTETTIATTATTVTAVSSSSPSSSRAPSRPPAAVLLHESPAIEHIPFAGRIQKKRRLDPIDELFHLLVCFVPRGTLSTEVQLINLRNVSVNLVQREVWQDASNGLLELVVDTTLMRDTVMDAFDICNMVNAVLISLRYTN
jgi:hypothetical protein